jgi:hypothetical protein
MGFFSAVCWQFCWQRKYAADILGVVVELTDSSVLASLFREAVGNFQDQ